jgi:broad specificity phosphatase PhoE
MYLIRHGQSEFNRLFAVTRKDPGIRDPRLTEHGRGQVAAAAQALARCGVRRLIASPYSRALETADIIATHLAAAVADSDGVASLPIRVDTLIGERYAFTCDVGSQIADLRARWPHLDFAHLSDPWWPQEEESEDALGLRRDRFLQEIVADDWTEIAVVSHWGFIRALTGLTVSNATVLRIDPRYPEREPEIVFVPTDEKS